MRYFRDSVFAIGLLASATVAAQSTDFGFVDDPNFSQQDFSRVYQQSSGRIYIIGNFNDLIASAVSPVSAYVPNTKFDSGLTNLDQDLVTVEGDGLLLPTDRLDTQKK